MSLGKSGRREDDLLDVISELVRKREACLRQIEAWEITDPTLLEILFDIRRSLLDG